MTNRCPFVNDYKHLGNLFDDLNNLNRAASLRRAQGYSTLRQLGPKVFSNGGLTKKTRVQPSATLLLQQLQINVHVWHTTIANVFEKLDHVALNTYRRIARASDNPDDVSYLTDWRLCADLWSPHLSIVLRCNRLRYLGRVLRNGATPLIALLQATSTLANSWCRIALDDIQ